MTVHTTPKSLSDVLHISNLSQKSQADRLVTTVSFFLSCGKSQTFCLNCASFSYSIDWLDG